MWKLISINNVGFSWYGASYCCRVLFFWLKWLWNDYYLAGLIICWLWLLLLGGFDQKLWSMLVVHSWSWSNDTLFIYPCFFILKWNNDCYLVCWNRICGWSVCWLWWLLWIWLVLVYVILLVVAAVKWIGLIRISDPHLLALLYDVVVALIMYVC